MAPPSTPSGDTIKITFSDIPSALVLEDILRPSTRFQACVAKLHAITGQVVHLLEGLPQRRVQGQGLTLTDGPWWYRLVKPGDTGGGLRLVKGAWKRLQNRYDYDNMLTEARLKIGTDDGWIEFKHEWQKQRDDAKAVQDFVDRKLPLTVSHQPQPITWPQDSARNASPDSTGLHDAASSRVLTPLIVSNSTGMREEVQESANNQTTSPNPLSQAAMTLSSSRGSQNSKLVEGPSQINTPPNATENGVYGDSEYVGHLDDANDRHRRLSVTPRPGPFPAQIGTPPSDAYDQYQAAFPADFNCATFLSDEAIVKEGLRVNTDRREVEDPTRNNDYANQPPLYNGTGFVTYDTHPMTFTAHDASLSSYSVPETHGMQYAYSQQPNLAQLYPGGQANLNLGYHAAPYLTQTPTYQQGHVAHWQFSNPMPFQGSNAHGFGHTNPNEWYVPFSQSHCRGQPSSRPWTAHMQNVNTDAMKDSDVGSLHSQSQAPLMQYSYGTLGPNLGNPPSANASPYYHLPAQHGDNTEVQAVPRPHTNTNEDWRFPHPSAPSAGNLTREGLQEYADFLKARYSSSLRTQATLLPSLPGPIETTGHLREAPMPELVHNRSRTAKIVGGTNVGAIAAMSNTNDSRSIDQNRFSFSAQHIPRTAETSSSTFEPPVNQHPPPTGLFSLRTSQKGNSNGVQVSSERGTKRNLNSSVDMTTAVKRGATTGLNLKTPEIKFGFDSLRSAEEEVQRPTTRSHASLDDTDGKSSHQLADAGSRAASSSSPIPTSATSADDTNPVRKEYQRRIQTKQANKQKELVEKREKERLEGLKAKTQTEGRKERAQKRASLRGFDLLDEEHEVGHKDDGEVVVPVNRKSYGEKRKES